MLREKGKNKEGHGDHCLKAFEGFTAAFTFMSFAYLLHTMRHLTQLFTISHALEYSSAESECLPADWLCIGHWTLR